MKRVGIFSLLVVMVAGCGSSNSTSNNRLTRTDQVEPGDKCPEGGVAILSGLDTNSDGVLSDDEVSMTQYVCSGKTGSPGADKQDGKDGHRALIKTEEEPAGENCPSGGYVVKSGIDANDNGELDDDEVSATDYICNGQPGTGVDSLVSVQEEPAGTNCAQGGQAIRSGLDANGDGALQPSEVQGTSYVCNGATGKTSLVRQEDATATDCSFGGRLVYTGVDTNGDGYLDDDEIQHTAKVCNAAEGKPGASSLFNVVSESAGATCPAGGYRLETGLDSNGNGQLDASEVANTSHVCNGQTGSSSRNGLVKTTSEPAGANCAAGGKKVQSGIDANDNGALDATEVYSTSYVCNAQAGTNGTDAHGSLVHTTTEPAGANCTAGGYKLQSGIDANDNGTLDATEISSTRYLCNAQDGTNGTNAHNSLVNTTTEPAGSNCATGGHKVQSGIDANDNGTLDATEVSSTSYLCNAQDGTNGTNAHNSLVNTTTEPAGSNCAAGGHKVQSGIDANDNGTLDATEVSATSYVCSEERHMAIRTSNAAWGGVCTRGGVKVETGLDDDADGILDNAEVDHVQYVCNLFVVQISTGYRHTCEVISDGTARCWGWNYRGQLGDGTTTQRLSPVQVHGLSNASQISLGYQHTCAVISDGTVRCWGYNNYGQLGDGTTTKRFSPVPVPGLTGVSQISAGYYHTCTRQTDGTAWCWGRNGNGQIGDGTTTSRHSPVQVPSFSGVSQISAGKYYTCTRKTDGSAWCWGDNGYGQLGDGSTTDSHSPAKVPGLSGVSQISAGYYHTCTRQTDGTARCWGYNHYGRLGDGSTTNRHSPVQVTGLTGVSRISAGDIHTCAVISGGTARCWGGNSHGQLGDGTTTERHSPVQVTGLSSVSRISAGYAHTCTRQTDGTARCWGYNQFGQVGDGTATDRHLPVHVPGDLSP